MKFKNSHYFLLTLFAFIILSVVLHEMAHEQINNSYDIESKIEYFKYLPEGKFKTVVSQFDYNNKCNDFCKASHNLNDSIFYNLQSLLAILGLGILLIILAIEKKQDKKE